jgi:hypothetical protein
VACLPSVAAFLRAGGWPAIRHRVLQAAALLLMTAAGLAALKAWSVRLDAAQRNGGVWGYSALFVVTALVSAAAIGAGTAGIVATVRRVDLPPRVLRVCGGLADTLTTAMTALGGGTVIGWAAMAAVAPGSLGGPAAAPGVGIPSLMVIVGLLMVLGLAGGVAGAWRVITSLRRMA